VTEATSDTAAAPGAASVGGVDKGLERLTFFSDGVIAIAMTLLALDLPLPTGADDAARWRSFAHLLSQQYLSFLLSFVVVAAYWSAHRRFFDNVSRLGPGVVALNMLFLFAIVELPFATRVLGDDGPSQVGTVVYAVAVAAVGLSLLLLLWQVRRRGLLRADVPARMPGDMTRRIMVPVTAFVASIPIAFASTSAAHYSWLVLSMLGSVVLRVYRRRSATVTAAAG
jgi:uncharacterized membrane protein